MALQIVPESPDPLPEAADLNRRESSPVKIAWGDFTMSTEALHLRHESPIRRVRQVRADRIDLILCMSGMMVGMRMQSDGIMQSEKSDDAAVSERTEHRIGHGSAGRPDHAVNYVPSISGFWGEAGSPLQRLQANPRGHSSDLGQVLDLEFMVMS